MSGIGRLCGIPIDSPICSRRSNTPVSIRASDVNGGVFTSPSSHTSGLLPVIKVSISEMVYRYLLAQQKGGLNGPPFCWRGNRLTNTHLWERLCASCHWGVAPDVTLTGHEIQPLGHPPPWQNTLRASSVCNMDRLERDRCEHHLFCECCP